jgi:hypothetical protein
MIFTHLPHLCVTISAKREWDKNILRIDPKLMKLINNLHMSLANSEKGLDHRPKSVGARYQPNPI